MKPFVLLTIALLAPLSGAHAQSFCASDGQPQPMQLMERFINADCDSCWTDPTTPRPAAHVMALDWVVPGSQGDDAPLSPVASRDAIARLESLGLKAPTASSLSLQRVKGLRSGKPAVLRVAHGLPLNDYLGVSIELKPIPAVARGKPWTAWLALVETLPAGTEGSPTERNLVRNLLQTNWDGRKQLLKTEQNRFFDARAMYIAPDVTTSRLRVMGWVEDDKGRVMAAAQSRCGLPP